jgi:hypothetical protein
LLTKDEQWKTEKFLILAFELDCPMSYGMLRRRLYFVLGLRFSRGKKRMLIGINGS